LRETTRAASDQERNKIAAFYDDYNQNGQNNYDSFGCAILEPQQLSDNCKPLGGARAAVKQCRGGGAGAERRTIGEIFKVEGFLL